jgi:catechol 2,3-dioxygenase-like lactoylglutathione lyase family enzyme
MESEMRLAQSIVALALALAAALPAQAQQASPNSRFDNVPKFDPAIEVGFAVLNVADLEKSVTYYEALGLTVTLKTVAHSGVPGTPESKDVPMAIFQTARGVDSTGLHLVQHDGPVNLGTAYNRLGIRVVDVFGVCKALAAMGTPCLREPRVVAGGSGLAIAWARDPDGRLLELVQQSS